jgi:photosystem II stability/assembly factor-like uncharacterized protein
MIRHPLAQLNWFLVLLFLATPLLAQTKWEKRMQGLPAEDPYYGVAVADSGVVWISSPQKLWRSSNLGLAWTQVTLPTSSGSPMKLVVSNYQNVMFCTTTGKIFKTTDGGAHWFKAFDDTTVTTFLNDFEMFDELHGFAIGDPANGSARPGLVRTTDGGWTWSVVQNNLPIGDIQELGRTDFINLNVGWSKAWNDGIYKTTNAGADWTLVFSPIFPHNIAFLDDTIGVCNALGATYGMTYKTTNGGVSWDSTHKGGSFSFFRGAPHGERLWGGSDTLFLSTDKGTTWQPQFTSKSVGSRTTFQWADFWSNDSGLVVGDGVVVALIHDPTSGTPTEAQQPQQTSLSQNYPNPFNPKTAVSYQLSAVSKTTIVVIDMLGRAVATLLDEIRGPGSYTVNWDASGMPSGIYFCRMTAGARVFTIKLALVK